MSDDLAKRVRMALGPYDDPDRPITGIIGGLRDAIAKAEKERDALVKEIKDIYERWTENLLEDWEVCVEVRDLVEKARSATPSPEDE